MSGIREIKTKCASKDEWGLMNPAELISTPPALGPRQSVGFSVEKSKWIVVCGGNICRTRRDKKLRHQ